jgi:hypothetical protein
VVTIDCGNFSRKDVILGQGDPTQRPKDGDIQDDYKRMTRLWCIYENDDQGRSQGSTGVTVVRGPQAQGAPGPRWPQAQGGPRPEEALGPGGPQARGGPGRVPKRPQEGSQKKSGPGKGCKSKGRCGLFLRKRNKIRKKNQSKGVLRVIGGPGSP